MRAPNAFCKNMTRQKPRIGAVLLIGVACAMLLTTHSAYLAPLIVQGETASFRYTAQDEGNNQLYIVVSIEFHDTNALEKYRQVNEQRALRLAKEKVKDVPVSITFARPIPQSEAHALALQAGLEVRQFTMVGHSNLSRERGVFGALGALDQVVEQVREISWTAEGERLVLEGVMVVKGQLRNAKTLPALLSDKRIHLVDTSEFEVRQVLAQQHAAVTAGKTIVVSVPSPFWMLDW